MHPRWLKTCLLVMALIFLSGNGRYRLACADDKPSDAATKAALAFAREHHPELADLLEQLRKNAPKEFAAAVSDLDKSRQRIERNKSSSERYRLELEEWKVNSRIRLLVARFAMGQDATIEAELRSAIEQRTQLRLALLEEERARLQQRIEKIDEQIAQQKERSTEQVNKELTALLKSAVTRSTAKDATKSKNTTNTNVSTKKLEKKTENSQSPATDKAQKSPVSDKKNKP